LALPKTHSIHLENSWSTDECALVTRISAVLSLYRRIGAKAIIEHSGFAEGVGVGVSVFR
jgi:hypothetical protein